MGQTFSPFRSRATFKPRQQGPGIDVYICPGCGRSYQALGYGEHAAPVCCGRPAFRLSPVAEAEFPQGFKVSYSIEGGLNYDAVRVSWRCPEGVSPDWILLRTFTGSYIRYLTPGKKAPMVFALADEDAYVYCDKKVCERCTFRCKQGFAVYVCVSRPEPLLLEVTLDKVAPRFRTRLP
jgi:hypothetical protein